MPSKQRLCILVLSCKNISVTVHRGPTAEGPTDTLTSRTPSRGAAGAAGAACRAHRSGRAGGGGARSGPALSHHAASGWSLVLNTQGLIGGNYPAI